MNNYKPNSHAYKEGRTAGPGEKKVEKVVKGKVNTRKRNKFADIFISEDVNNVKSYIVMDVLIPAAKKLLSEIVTDSIDMILFGESGRSKKRSGSSPYVSYNRYSDRERRDDRRSVNSRSRFDYDDILFESRGDAEAVLDQMYNILENYDVVTVADVYDMADRTAPYTSNRFGWTNLRNAEVVRVRGGDYMIKLPKAMAID